MDRPARWTGWNTRALTREDESNLVSQWFRRRDPRAGQRLVEAHFWLVAKELRRFRASPIPREDLWSEGCWGLVLALERFRPRGVRFATYARSWVQACLLGVHARWRREKARSRDRQEEDRDDDVESEGPTEPFESHDDASPEAALGKRQELQRVREVVSAARLDMDLRQQMILDRRVMAEEEETLNILAEQLGISRERVRQLECLLLEELGQKLRKAL